MGHDTIGSTNQNMTELTTGQEVDNPALNLIQSHVETGTDDSALVQTTIELNYDLICTVIIYDGEFTNVSYLYKD